MTRRTPTQEWKLTAFAERISLRELAQEAECPDCLADIGVPCIRRDNQPMERMDHPRRISAARQAREEAGR